MRTHYCCVRLFALPGRPFVLSTHRSSDYGPLAYFVPVSLFFLFFSWFVLFSFVVLRFPPPFRFVVFRLFPVSPSSLFLADFVILSRCPHSPHAACEPAKSSAYSPCVLSFLLLSCFLFLIFFLLFHPFFEFGLDVVCLSCLFLVGITLSPRFLLPLAQRIICMISDTYVR